ncbi:MAG: O-antigen ligase family protein, partial [Candidatus Buchananbacteria bacterium]
MPKSVASKIIQAIIWIGFAVILFSPLYISSALFFPFIVTKTIVFMLAVEVIFVAYLLLAWIDPNYRVRFNLVLLLMLIYIGILTLASLFGNDFYKGFWSNNERGDGILLLTHLFLFVLVLTSYLRKIKNWLYVLDIFLVASFCVGIVALDQYLGSTFSGFWKEHFLPSSNGARLAATIGNAGYVGGYMIFGVFVALFMLFKRKNLWLKLGYGVVVILELFIAIQTQTRGAWLALGILFPIFLIYVAYFYFNDFKGKYINGRVIKIIATVLVIVFIASIGLIFVNKNSSFVKSSPILSRITSISMGDVTTNNRLVTWNIAWQGILQRPILGYGQENFYQVFDKFYTTKNTEQWFDRSHDMVFDRAITGGFLGLISYFALLLVPFYFLWKFYKKADKPDD